MIAKTQPLTYCVRRGPDVEMGENKLLDCTHTSPTETTALPFRSHRDARHPRQPCEAAHERYSHDFGSKGPPDLAVHDGCGENDRLEIYTAKNRVVCTNDPWRVFFFFFQSEFLLWLLVFI